MTLRLIDEAVAAGARQERACEVLGLSPRTLQRWREGAGGEDRRRGPLQAPANKLSDEERAKILQLVNSQEFRDLSPQQIVPRLADRGIYVASEATVYRLLRQQGQLSHRIGLRDVRDYRLLARTDEASLGTSSPFNVKVRSLTLENFTAAEVTELWAQHTAETRQAFSPEAVTLAFELTQGQPWLVNALADQVVGEEALDPGVVAEAVHVERAKEALIQRRETHLDSLLDRLRSWCSWRFCTRW